METNKYKKLIKTYETPIAWLKTPVKHFHFDGAKHHLSPPK